MSGNAGSFIRDKMVRFALYCAAGAGGLIGLAIGMLFYTVFPRWIGFGWGLVAFTTTAVVVFLIVIRVLDRPSYRWNLDNLKKGVDAETRVGRIIERAITANNCAVAHSVTEIAKIGDIDHIVATPVAVWVIETRYQKVPQEQFSKVLNRIATNMNAVRQWAPDKTTVRGCLVLAYENESVKKSRWGTTDNGGKENIAVYARPSLDTLEQEMRKEAGKTPSLDERIAKKIWRLGSATGSEQPHGSDQIRGLEKS